MPCALEPEMRVWRLRWTRACEDVLQRFIGDSTEGGRVDGLPERLAQPVLAAEPERAGNFPADQAVVQRLLVAPLPDAAVVVVDEIIDIARTGQPTTDDEPERAER